MNYKDIYEKIFLVYCDKCLKAESKELCNEFCPTVIVAISEINRKAAEEINNVLEH